MRPLISLIVLSIFSTLILSPSYAKDKTEKFRGGHPSIMFQLWDGTITIETAQEMQNCIDMVTTAHEPGEVEPLAALDSLDHCYN